MKKTLIIIDFQYDFCDPKGSLYVKGAEEAKKGIINYMEKNHKSFNQIIYTQDWHTPQDWSFKKNGKDGLWPDHCVQNSHGAEIDGELLKKLREYKIEETFFKKGTVYTHEEYGAFENCRFKGGDKNDIKNYFFNNYGNDKKTEISIFNKNVVVCGLAGDYCVKESTKSLLNHFKFNLELLVSGIASIDNGDTLKKFMEDNKIPIAK